MEQTQNINGTSLLIQHYGDRYFALYEGENLVCVTVYKKGSMEVKRRLEELTSLIGGERNGL